MLSHNVKLREEAPYALYKMILCIYLSTPHKVNFKMKFNSLNSEVSFS